MGMLKPALNQTAFLKLGILGFQGSGKTYTASRIAAPLAKLSNEKAPSVAIFDTEKSSDFLVEYFKAEGVDLLVSKSRAFKDSIAFLKECQQEKVSVAIIDSISHVWKDLLESYKRKLNREDLYFGDWADIKAEWQQIADLFVNLPVHIMMLGRAGYEYDLQENSRGKKELVKTGTKMKAEGEFGYESDLLMEMVRVPKKKGWVNRAWILKDRRDLINGKSFDQPSFKDFEPVIKKLNLGGEHFGVDLTRDSQDIFSGKDFSYADEKRKRDIAVEELQATLIKLDLDGSKQETKKRRVEMLEQVYGTSSKTAIERMWASQIKAGIKDLQNLVNPPNVDEVLPPPPPKKEEKKA